MHGDQRGSVDRIRNVPDTPMNPPDGGRLRIESARMRHRPVVFDADCRVVVEGAIRDHGRVRGWAIHAVNVRSNHVHVVVENSGEMPERMMAQFKSWATRRLREAGLAEPDGRVWVDHGSTRYLWKEVSVAEAVRYVDEGQDVGR